MNLFKKTKQLLQVMSIMALTVSFVACNKKDDNTNSSYNGINPYGINGLNNCSNCQGLVGGSTLAQVQGASADGSVLMTLNILGQGNNGYNPYGNMVSTYSGQVGLQGAMNIQSQSYALCGAPAGSYNITTVQAGQMYYGTMSGVKIMADNGQVRLVLNVGQGILYGLTSGQPRIGLYAAIESVNGQYCAGYLSTY